MKKETPRGPWVNEHGEVFLRQPCCEKARKVFCVCFEKHDCETHGSKCHGSHD